MSHRQGITAEVEEFIFGHIKTVTALEILCVLVAVPDRAWTAVELDTALRSNLLAIRENLESLCKRDVLECDREAGTYRIKAERADLMGSVEATCRMFKSHQSRIIELIYSDRRSHSLRQFADAFKFSKPGGEKPDGEES